MCIEIHLHIYKNNFIDLNYVYKYLSNFELERFNKIIFSKDKYLYAMSKILLKKIICESFNVEIKDIVIDFAAGGKPYLKWPNKDFFFNISHTEGAIAIAIAPFEIGVDVENVYNRIFSDRILKYVFHDSEISSINVSLNKNKKKFLFWTRKEAILKASGFGLIDGLYLINTNLHNIFIFKKFWKIISYDLKKIGIVCSLSYEGDSDFPVRFYLK